MTRENRIFITPQDILRIGFECPHCHATYLVPVAAIDREVVRNCPNCRESIATDASVLGSDDSDLRVLNVFIRYLRTMQSRKFGTSIRMEVDAEVMPSASQTSELEP